MSVIEIIGAVVLALLGVAIGIGIAIWMIKKSVKLPW